MSPLTSSALNARIEALMQEHSVPGLSIAVVQQDNNTAETTSRAYGLATIDPPVKLTPDTLFCIASCSKSLTAGAVAILVADDDNHPDIKWDATMSSLLPDDFVMAEDEYTKNITVDDVIGHRTACHGPTATQPDTARSVTRNLRNLPLATPLRSKHLYNNIMYTVLTHLIEIKTSHTFSAFLQSQIFQPLSMHSTYLQLSAAIAAGQSAILATPYEYSKPDQIYKTCTLPEGPESQGAGFIITSANDFIKWVSALIQHDQPPVTDVVYAGLTTLRSFSQEPDQTPRKFASPYFYSAGLETYYYRGYTVIGHGGSDPGFGAYFFLVPELKFGAVLMGNSGGATALTEIVARILIDEVLEVPVEERGDPSVGFESSDESSDDDDDDDNDDEQNEPDQGQSSSKPLPLDSYSGDYHNRGYHTLSLRIQNQQLFIDATDRAMGFTATLRQTRNGTDFVAHTVDAINSSERRIKVRFGISDDHVVSRFGINLEPDLGELIWFDRV